MKISKLIELLNPYADMEAECEYWCYNEQRDVRVKVTGIKVLVAEEGVVDIVIVIPENDK